MVLVDLAPMGLTGRLAEEALGKVNIVVNRNAIPYDPRPPRVASGLRLGTPAVTSRGFGIQETAQVARLITRTLSNIHVESVAREVRDEVLSLASRFPVPGIDA
jgi:glycine hydroxymethyltransferase